MPGTIGVVYIVLRAQNGTETLEAVNEQPGQAVAFRDERRKFEAELQRETGGRTFDPSTFRVCELAIPEGLPEFTGDLYS